MKNLRYMLIAACSACLLLPLGSCMDTDMNRNKYEVATGAWYRFGCYYQSYLLGTSGW